METTTSPVPDRSTNPRDTSIELIGVRFRITATADDLVDSINQLFADSLSVADDRPGLSLTVSANSDGGFLVEVPGYSEPFPSLGRLSSGLVTILNRQSLDHDATRLHLHAGVVSLGGMAALIVAPSGAGKTTTTAAFCCRGWTYHSDEMACLTEGSQFVQTWPKPLSIKRSGFARLGTVLSDAALAGAQPFIADQNLPSWQIPPSALGFEVRRSAEPRLVVLLTGQTDPGPIRPSPADTVVALVEQTMDLERFGKQGLHVLAELASRCPALSLGRDEPSQMAERIESGLSNKLSIEQLDVETLDTSSEPDLAAVRIGDEVVLRNARTGKVASLRTSGAEAFLRGAARNFSGTGVRPGDVSFFESLSLLGLIGPMSAKATQ